MRDRVYEYLLKSQAPVPADEIVRNVLGIQCSCPALAGRILGALLGEDPRFAAAGGLWRVGFDAIPADLAPDGVATLYVEGSVGPQPALMARGAVCCRGEALEFGVGENAGRPELRELEEARARLDGRLLAVWNRNSLTLWNRLQHRHGLSSWDGPALVLAVLARRLLPDLPARPVPDDLAGRLSLLAPASDSPGALARFLSDAIPVLLDMVPEAHRSNFRSLRAWMEAEFPEPDFARFTFDRAFLRNLPEAPGVYVMRGSAGAAIYVGKARNLKRRVGSYFARRSLRDPKTAALHARLHSLEILPAASEIDALLMEMRLIRKLRPEVNRQTEVHRSRTSHARQYRWILLVPNATLDRARLYLLKEGAFVHQACVRLGHPPSESLKKRVRSALFGGRSGKKARAPWEQEIVFRWLARNRARLNVIDVDASGGAAATVRILTDYLLDPDRLSRRVLYR